MQKYLEQTEQELKLRNYNFKTIKGWLAYPKEYSVFSQTRNLKRFEL
jgi:hypothetical protein